jgi:hypothetical protein
MSDCFDPFDASLLLADRLADIRTTLQCLADRIAAASDEFEDAWHGIWFRPHEEQAIEMARLARLAASRARALDNIIREMKAGQA